MALFSENIVYRSTLNAAEVLRRVTNAIEIKGITHLEYWTEPARFFRGKLTGNNFHIVSTSRRKWIKPSVEGAVTETAAGSLITIKISPTGLGRLLLYLVAIMMLLMVLGVFRDGQLWIVGIVALVALTASAATYPWSCWSAKIRLEEIFQAKGEKQ